MTRLAVFPHRSRTHREASSWLSVRLDRRLVRRTKLAALVSEVRLGAFVVAACREKLAAHRERLQIQDALLRIAERHTRFTNAHYPR